MNTSSPLVSIGMPVRNGGALFREALASVVVQDHANLEIIISDNASTDETPDIIAEFQTRDPRIVAIRHQAMLPVMENFTCVLKQARGEFFAWAAHDDTRSPDFVSKLLPAFAEEATVLAFPDLLIRSSSESSGQLKPYNFANEGLSPLGRLRKQVMMQCFHIYGLWRLETLRSVDWRHGSWWPDMPLMAVAAYKGGFRHVSGPVFNYLEIVKSNEDRAREELGKKPHSRFANVSGLAWSCATTAWYTAGILPAVAAFAFVFEKYIRIAADRLVGGRFGFERTLAS